MGKFKQISRTFKAKPWKSLGLAVGSAAVAGSVAYILLKREKDRKSEEERPKTVSVRGAKKSPKKRKKKTARKTAKKTASKKKSGKTKK